jgi:hypothetical protein
MEGNKVGTQSDAGARVQWRENLLRSSSSKSLKTCVQWYGMGRKGKNLQIERGCCREERLDTVVLVLNIDCRTVFGE